MKKMLLSALAMTVILSASAQNDYFKLTDGKGMRVIIVNKDDAAGTLTYKLDSKGQEATVKLSDVAIIETEKDDIAYYSYDKEAKNIDSPELRQRSAENPRSLMAKGGKVYIPLNAGSFRSVLGSFNMRKELTDKYNLWTVVDTPLEAEFILEFVFDEDGRDTCYFILKTREGAEFYRSESVKTVNAKNSFKFTIFNPRVESADTVAKLCKQELMKTQKN